MNAFLSAQKSYPWITRGKLSFRGYFILEGICYRGEAATDYLENNLTFKNAQTLFCSLNGVFSVILETNELTLFGVDRLRSLPLFYAVQGGELWVGDDIDTMVSSLPERRLNRLSMEEYRSSDLFVTGKYTLLQDVFQVQAASFCVYDPKSNAVAEQPYFRMEHSDFSDDVSVLTEGFHRAYQETACHLVQALNGRTAVVPLSGGADSRMVLSMLKQEGYEKVLCYTYGSPGNSESEISRQVAGKFGYRWVMVPYSKEMWKALREDPETAAYMNYAFAYTSTPHMQDFPAVKYLKEHHMLPDDSVFVPGHSGDLIAGSHITAEFLNEHLPREAFLHTIEAKFYQPPLSSQLHNKVETRFAPCLPEDMEALASQSEWFNVQERQAKFIVNSVRVYDFFGYEWLIPLWDSVLFEFWKHVPISLRYKRKLYFSVLHDTVSSTNDITAKKKLAARIRTIPALATVARRGTRIKRYWKSPLAMEHFFSFSTYIHACFFEFPTFTVNTLLCKEKLHFLEQEINYDKEE